MTPDGWEGNCGPAESNGSLLLGLWYACVSLRAWWEVVAAHHRVHDCMLSPACWLPRVRDLLRPLTLDHEYGYLYLLPKLYLCTFIAPSTTSQCTYWVVQHVLICCWQTIYRVLIHHFIVLIIWFVTILSDVNCLCSICLFCCHFKSGIVIIVHNWCYLWAVVLVAVVNRLVDWCNHSMLTYIDMQVMTVLNNTHSIVLCSLSKQHLKYICISLSPINYNCFYTFKMYISDKCFSCWLHMKISTVQGGPKKPDHF